MRRRALLLIALLLGLLTGCNGQAASPTPTLAPTTPPIPTSETPPTALPSGPATCVTESFDFPVEPRIPPVTEDDHVHGPADAPVTVIEYADFQ